MHTACPPHQRENHAPAYPKRLKPWRRWVRDPSASNERVTGFQGFCRAIHTPDGDIRPRGQGFLGLRGPFGVNLNRDDLPARPYEFRKDSRVVTAANARVGYRVTGADLKQVEKECSKTGAAAIDET